MTAFDRVDPTRIVDFEIYAGEFEPMTVLRRVDDLRAKEPYYYSSRGYWMLTEMAHIREAMQRTDVFSNSLVNVSDPEPDYKWIPEMLDPPEHTRWRQLLAPLFAPGRVAQMKGKIRGRAAELVDAIASQPGGDFKSAFADRFPTSIFMELMGLPTQDSDQFMEWERLAMNSTAEEDPDRSIAAAAMRDVTDYFRVLIEEKRAQPADDLVSIALTWQIDGRPIREDDLLSLCLLMFLAGLDTMVCQLGWVFWHLASFPTDRRQIVNNLELIPSAIEEFLRVYTIVRPGRKVMQDIDFHGCQMMAGDSLLLLLSSACRDPKAFPEPDKVLLGREGNNHIAFGAGPHRCLGSHLARLEIRVAIEEWHKRIPDYSIDPEATIREFDGALLGIARLPLVW